MAHDRKQDIASIATGQVTVGTSATLIAPVRPGRNRIVLTAAAATQFFIGASGVTTGNGLPVPAGGSVALETTAAIYGIVAAATLAVGYLEEF